MVVGFYIDYKYLVRKRYLSNPVQVHNHKSKHNIKLPFHSSNIFLVQNLKEKLYVAQKYHSERLVKNYQKTEPIYHSKKSDTTKHLDNRRKMRRVKKRRQNKLNSMTNTLEQRI